MENSAIGKITRYVLRNGKCLYYKVEGCMVQIHQTINKLGLVGVGLKVDKLCTFYTVSDKRYYFNSILLIEFSLKPR